MAWTDARAIAGPSEDANHGCVVQEVTAGAILGPCSVSRHWEAVSPGAGRGRLGVQMPRARPGAGGRAPRQGALAAYGVYTLPWEAGACLLAWLPILARWPLWSWMLLQLSRVPRLAAAWLAMSGVLGFEWAEGWGLEMYGPPRGGHEWLDQGKVWSMSATVRTCLSTCILSSGTRF